LQHRLFWQLSINQSKFKASNSFKKDTTMQNPAFTTHLKKAFTNPGLGHNNPPATPARLTHCDNTPLYGKPGNYGLPGLNAPHP
jgi:hypothetical protein